ncbi:efflux RND transporter periplasmic adaptor subunit [Wenyingzhuangia marina]|uniref:HlyD family secretion protein n=1 Tax=Wenyingzhuangia marina TaxID=1195760 RepID=A0A1M5W6W5_9FLAO|nr:efflux RND transporter periplasmic adaptor subunit [Wenyingzhuangia marina]GGF75424.1 RND transporter MFP subunit [Wenyingzhuangia marina]SHH83220.1 HlyD family secretion protein [Wenyingzhuangia marina]
MKKAIKIIIIIVLFGALAFVLKYFIDKNSKSAIEYKTETPFTTTIVKKTVATGTVIPEDEVEIKPQISGIIEKIFVEEGAQVKEGDLIAKIKVVPNEQSLNSAKGRVTTAKLKLDNTTKEYERSKKLFEKGVIANQEFNTADLQYKQAVQDLANAERDYKIIKLGSATGSSSANTNIKATISGTILEIPVKQGDQVIESNNLNAGTTIAFIANLNHMIFEGKVDEAEVGKLKENTPLEITIGAINTKKFNADLTFIAPKGVDEQGAVMFKIKASLKLNDSINIRAGYSANAALILDKSENILAVKESLVQYDKETEKPYVEIEQTPQQFVRKDISLGLSDGINVEVTKGISKEDKIKVWNQVSGDPSNYSKN